MGSRFDSSVRSKDHIRPKKKDGPGPGSYALGSSIRTTASSTVSDSGKKSTTFGYSMRGKSSAA